jgi:hypothetical protein
MKPFFQLKSSGKVQMKRKKCYFWRKEKFFEKLKTQACSEKKMRRSS